MTDTIRITLYDPRAGHPTLPFLAREEPFSSEDVQGYILLAQACRWRIELENRSAKLREAAAQLLGEGRY